MKVKILCEFEIEGLEGEDLTENQGKSAASMAAWDHLSLSNTGLDNPESVTVHVDGYGKCRVKIGEDHE